MVEAVEKLCTTQTLRRAAHAFGLFLRPVFLYNAAMSNSSADYQQLLRLLREVSLLGSVSAVLSWDEMVNLPPKGVAHRGNQSALLSRMIHEMFTSPRIGDLLSAVESSELVADGNQKGVITDF